MARIRASAGGAGGVTSAYGTVDFTAGANTTWSINVGITGYNKFVMYAYYSDTAGSKGFAVAWDSSNPTKYSALSATSANSGLGAIKLNSSLNDATAVRLGSLISCGGSTVQFKTASNSDWSKAMTVTWIAII